MTEMETSEADNGKRLYEGMFILKASSAGKDWAKVSGDVRKLLESHNAEIVLFEKWDERKLAYEIKKQNKGVYLLSFFKMNPSEVSPVKREVELSGIILRMLLLKCDRPFEKITIRRPGDTPEEDSDFRGGPDGGDGHRRPRFPREDEGDGPRRDA